MVVSVRGWALTLLALGAVQAATDDLSGCKGEISFIKDGECDVDLNNAECMWDGGDCCECECEEGLHYLCGGFGFKCLDPDSECNILDSTCSNGLPGIESAPDDDGERACCPRECGQCGGPVCFTAGMPDYDEHGCCDNTVINFHNDCDEAGAAPCVISKDAPSAATTPTPTIPEGPTCSNGIPGIENKNKNGVACCDAGCGFCGGEGCHGFPGGRSKCCIDIILNKGDKCDDSGEAPCFLSITSES